MVRTRFDPNGEMLHTVFSLSRIALDHLLASLEAREGHVRNRVLLMVGLLCGDDGSKGCKREVDARETEKEEYVYMNNACLRRCDGTHGTKFVWNSFKSTLREPSNLRDAVMDETT